VFYGGTHTHNALFRREFTIAMEGDAYPQFRDLDERLMSYDDWSVSREQRTESREQRVESREQRAESREQRTESSSATGQC
jgi:hypothetical protein